MGSHFNRNNCTYAVLHHVKCKKNTPDTDIGCICLFCGINPTCLCMSVSEHMINLYKHVCICRNTRVYVCVLIHVHAGVCMCKGIAHRFSLV